MSSARAHSKRFGARGFTIRRSQHVELEVGGRPVASRRVAFIISFVGGDATRDCRVTHVASGSGRSSYTVRAYGVFLQAIPFAIHRIALHSITSSCCPVLCSAAVCASGRDDNADRSVAIAAASRTGQNRTARDRTRAARGTAHLFHSDERGS